MLGNEDYGWYKNIRPRLQKNFLRARSDMDELDCIREFPMTHD